MTTGGAHPCASVKVARLIEPQVARLAALAASQGEVIAPLFVPQRLQRFEPAAVRERDVRGGARHTLGDVDDMLESNAEEAAGTRGGFASMALQCRACR